MIEPLFWNPLPAAAVWLAQRTGRAFDARSLVDAVASMGKQGTPDPTIIRALLPQGLNFATLTMAALETDPVDVDVDVDDGVKRLQKETLNKQFGPLPLGIDYVRAAYPTFTPLAVSELLALLLYGEKELSVLLGVQTQSPQEMVWLMPWGTTHRATLETCGINRSDLLALGDTLTTDTNAEAMNPKPLQRTAAQDLAILGAIKQAGHNPLALPINTNNWKMKIQSEAASRFKRLRASGASPTVNSILVDMVTWCRANDVKTDGGIFPAAGYLRTHVLSGKHWKRPL